MDVFPFEKDILRKNRDVPPAGSIVNPAAIRNHYNISDSIVGTNANNLQAVAEYDNQWYDDSDLSLFFQRNDLPDTPVEKVT